MSSIYKITNIINGKSYVGYTSREKVQERIAEHFSPSVYNGREKRPLYSAIKKYGKESFTWEVLYEGNDALDKEPEFIAKYGDYNLHEGGNVPPSQKGKTWKLSEETRENMKGKCGKWIRTQEHKKKMSDGRKGSIPWNKGKKGFQKGVWAGKRDSGSTKKWIIHKSNGDLISIDNLVLWCEENGYNPNSVKYHYYKGNFPGKSYKDIINIVDKGRKMDHYK